MMKQLVSLEFNSKEATLYLYLNKLGIRYLINKLKELESAGKNDHEHLMTPEWGGNELVILTPDKQEDEEHVNHLKIVYSPDYNLISD